MVLSELCRRRLSAKVAAWMRGLPEAEVFISVVSIGEIERGIAKATDAAFATELTRWLEDLMRFYSDRVLPVTPLIARRWGRLSAQLGHDGADLLIAATAAVHGLTVATRNLRHFARAGVPVMNPFAGEASRQAAES